MKLKKPLAAPQDKCDCGHAYAEHVQSGPAHGCQHGAQPPYKNECLCTSFRLPGQRTKGGRGRRKRAI